MKVSISLFLLSLASFVSAQGQHRLSGSVIDFETKKQIGNASIYLPDLKRGVVSNTLGDFRIDRIPSGKVLLDVSLLGYRAEAITFHITRDTLVLISLRQSIIQTDEVVILGSSIRAKNETSFSIGQLTAQVIAQDGALSISDALSKLPGLSQLTTGPLISKPVIRGLYGNRIQINVNGIRFDNQQWQDEHGLGLSTMGIDRVEVIRGPAAVLYGSDAIGGVVNVVDEKPADLDTQEQDLNASLFSNTYGLSLNYGKKSSNASRWKKFRIGMDSHADYADGKGTRILNSRADAYNMKSSWGRQKKNNVYVRTLTVSASRFGFVFDSLSRKGRDARLSRSFDGPHHAVAFAQFTHENTYYRHTREFKLNAGFISNLRLEDEGGGGISLSMLLNTVNALGQVTQPLGKFGQWIYGGSLMFQTNTNFGGRIIVPDAITAEFSGFSYYQYKRNLFFFESGIRADEKLVETFATNTLNVVGNESPTEEILPFTKLCTAFNFSLGAGYNVSDGLGLKVNASTGYRPGNLAELSSNGLHEGTLRWEIGLSNARIEQNLNLEGTLLYTKPFFRASLSVYRNMFSDFFYLASTGTEYFGFAVYHFRQSDASLQGGEFSVEASVPHSPLNVQVAYNVVKAERENGNPLPFIPAAKLSVQLMYTVPLSDATKTLKINLGAQHVGNQDRPAEFETATSFYTLLDAGASLLLKKNDISIRGHNVTNEIFYDHLSRYKYYGFSNMGRMIVIAVRHKF